MDFSIITPCKSNDVKKLTALKNNLDQQSGVDFEWIIASNKTIDNFSDASFPIHIVNDSKDTVGSARNAAILNANGKYLVFIDVDDFLSFNVLKQAKTILDQNQNNAILDLNAYLTYEPENSFLEAQKQGKHYLDDLPKWGGRKIERPVNRQLKFNSKMINDLGIKNEKYSEWLKHPYSIYNQKDYFDHMKDELVVSGKIIPKQLFVDHNLKFDENNPLHSSVKLMLQVGQFTSHWLVLNDYAYILVRHNDPVNDPSLDQVVRPDRWEQWINACIVGYQSIHDPFIQHAFASYTIQKIHERFYKAVILHDSNIGNVQNTLKKLQNYLRLLSNRDFHSINILSQRILMEVKNGNFARAKYLMVSLIATRDAHKLVVNRGRGATRASYELLFKHLSVNPRVIIYESFLGRNYSDSPKYIYKYIQKHYPGKFLNVWVAANDQIKKDLKNEPNTIVVNRFGFKYMYYLATSKYQVFNMRQPKWFDKKNGTKFIETWHGTPLKHLVFDMDNVASATSLYKQIFYHQSRQWDYLVTANQFSANVFSHAFMYPKDHMLKSGYPRNDILNNPNRDRIARKIKIKLGIPLDKKVILYAPTWRDDQYFSAGNYKFQLKLDIAKLKRALGNDYVMVLRTHYFITNHLDTSSFGDFVYNESDYDDIAELYLISDLLITDYSSVFFDYSILKRPILYYVYDYSKYAGVLRGFYLNMEKDLPGPLLKTSDEVLNAIQNIDQIKDKYKDRYHQFNQRFSAWDDGHATERVVHAMLKNDPRIQN
ncbi:teichoic acid biosynthesis protein F [Philodulcilactobacillus myokoensis]|uniref:Teichoic acid biosynthesis protein F n=1 Tax=Philodulcilactobacillus myokoensis TaxID=2929573 RepID=A0A9W6B156_9LACO|nr:bifunctional glycosyltransferase family 2 protein/CDP-glycerol:glycerophosphate glycerophosphotransferase [Philodulcilactobacillus myokoensis]GLB46932.1 teichoic acid biosynthesis protein F [Philodulcilactobacillus myokoensis]